MSGGNIDPVLMMKVVQHGMAAAGRYLSLRVQVPDRPGSLAALLRELAGPAANVLRSSTSGRRRGWTSARSRSASHLETRGPDHAQRRPRRTAAGRVRAPRRLTDR